MQCMDVYPELLFLYFVLNVRCKMVIIPVYFFSWSCSCFTLCVVDKCPICRTSEVCVVLCLLYSFCLPELPDCVSLACYFFSSTLLPCHHRINFTPTNATFTSERERKKEECRARGFSAFPSHRARSRCLNLPSPHVFSNSSGIIGQKYGRKTIHHTERLIVFYPAARLHFRSSLIFVCLFVSLSVGVPLLGPHLYNLLFVI